MTRQVESSPATVAERNSPGEDGEKKEKKVKPQQAGAKSKSHPRLHEREDEGGCWRVNAGSKRCGAAGIAGRAQDKDVTSSASSPYVCWSRQLNYEMGGR